MIQEQETFNKYGYYPSDLKPQSNRLILATCDSCGKVREIRKESYHALCKSCVKKGNTFCLGIKFTEEHKSNLSVAHTGEKSPNWQGGISFKPYCIMFNNKYKNYIRNFFFNVCFLCSKTEVDNGRALSVHHVNYNKDCGCDGAKCVCVPLCMECHAKTGVDRDFWQALITEMLKPIEAWM